MNKRPLFHKHPLRGVLEVQAQKLDERIASLGSDELRTADLGQLGEALYEEFKANPLAINEGEIAAEQGDVKVDVSGRFDRDIMDRTKPFLVDGIRVRYYVPFTGDEALLDCQPSTFTTVWPRVADVKGGELVFEYDRPDRSVVASKSEFAQDLGLFKQWMGWSTTEVHMFNSTLPRRIEAALAARRERLQMGQREVEKLGYKVRAKEIPPAPTPPSVPEVTPTRPRRKERQRASQPPERDYDVALSFAGEDRDYVDKVAEALRQAGVRVFYDRFEEVELWGKDLAEHFARIYGDGSRFIVLFVSKHYAAKAWPTYERRQALARSIREHDSVVILPVRFDDTEVPGLTDTRAYLDARQLGPDELAKRITAKIQLET